MEGKEWMVEGAGCRVQEERWSMEGAGCRAQAAGCRVQGGGLLENTAPCGRGSSESGPLRAVHLSRHKWTIL